MIGVGLVMLVELFEVFDEVLNALRIQELFNQLQAVQSEVGKGTLRMT